MQSHTENPIGHLDRTFNGFQLLTISQKLNCSELFDKNWLKIFVNLFILQYIITISQTLSSFVS